MFEGQLQKSLLDEVMQPHHQPSFAFIDADNVWKSYKKCLDDCGLTEEEVNKFDFFRLFKVLPHDRCYVYSATNETTKHPRWLSGLESEAGFLLKMGELVDKPKGSKQEGVDVKLAIDATRLAYSSIMKTCTLYGADGDFLPLVDAVSEAGTLVNIASFNDPAQGRVAPKLRATADRYFRMNALWLYEALSPKNSTVKDCVSLHHSWNDSDEVQFLEYSGQEFEVRKCDSTYLVPVENGPHIQWFGSHILEDLIIWLKVAPFRIESHHRGLYC